MSYSEPWRIILIYTIYVCIFLNAAVIAKVTEAQRIEIEKLRADLNQAFDAHEELEVVEKGVIVQPNWTKTDKPDPKTNSKVIVTNEGLAEAKILRDEITKAVKTDAYATNVTAGTKHVQQLERSFGLKERSKNVLDTMLSSSVPATEQLNTENVGAAFDDLDDDSIGPNIVDAAGAIEHDIDIRKLQSLEVAKRRTKEVLVLKSIVEDFNFDLGEDVLEWEHILHDGEEYFVGRREKDLLVVRKEAVKYEKGKVLDVGQPIAYIETYTYWSLELQKQEGIILVAARDNVLWYRVNNESHQLELYWKWSTGSTISSLSYFRIDTHEYLVVSTNQSSRSGYFTLNIYRFELQTQEFWIAQRLQLQHPCAEVTILDTGRDIVLTVVQKDQAAIYTFNPRAETTDHLRFQLRHSIDSEGIESIASFKMGGRSYFALGGMQPQILLYQQGELVPKTIFGQNFGLVQLFFPIPVRTYRDDLILLLQHRVDFGTHGLTVLETLIWNGESFEASIPVPCQLGPHTVYGVSCMLDIQRDEGLKGAALLKRGDEISIIVPRHKAESGLFRFHTELLAKNSELLDLQEIFGFLKDWVKEQDELIAQAQAFVNDVQSQEYRQVPDLTELEVLTTPELHFTGEIGEIHVNDYHWTQADSDVDLDFLLDSIEELGQELLSGRNKRELTASEPTFDSLEFDEVDVEELLIEMHNNEQFYIQDGIIDFDGILNIQNLRVLEKPQSRANEETNEEIFVIDGNLEFDEINGVSWDDIKQGLVFRNKPLKLAELTVDGEVIVEDRLTVNHLNTLKFPEEYLWSSGPTTSVVRAEKEFEGTLAANAVDMGGLLNGVNPFDAITLSDPQDWMGLTTFANLEVSEKLELNGSAQGRGLEDFESNPTLLESNTIEATCNFAHLEVHGSVFLKGQFENQDISNVLADIVQRPTAPDEEVSIQSAKSFSDITFPIDFHLTEGLVNNISVDQFITLHTKQDLNITTLQGYVYFNNLTINGSYDGVKIEELLESSIKIDVPQTANNTQLQFTQPIVADKFDVLETLNAVPIATGYQTVLEDLVAPELIMDVLQADIGDIHGDIHGDADFNGVNLHDFLGKRNWSGPADTGNIFIDELTLQSGLETDALHGIDAEFLLNFLEHVDDIPEMILDGKIRVDHVIVTGDVQVHKLNGHNFDEDIQLRAIWLDRPNYLSTNLTFLKPVQVNAALYCEGNMNGVDLPDLIDDMVFHNTNQTVHIVAPKNFVQSVRVMGDTNVDAVNGLRFEHIATRSSLGIFEGNLQIDGNLYVKELEVYGHLNDYPMSNLSSLVRFDPALRTFVLTGEITLPASMQLQDLTVDGDLNEFENMSSFFENLVYKNNICILKGKTTFTGRVAIEKGAYVRNLNGYNLIALMDNIVYVRESKPIIIKAPVTFAAPVKARDVTIRETLTTSNLNGCSLQDWLQDCLRVDKDQNITSPIHFGIGAMDGNSLTVNFLNNIDMSQVITLHTAQNISSNLLFSQLYLDGTIISKGPVNDVDLKEEYENTFLITPNQRISTPLTLQSCHVLKTLITNAPVNGVKDLHQVATLHDSLEFRSPLFLQNVTARNLYTNDLVSGINLDHWQKNTLWLQGRPQQWVTGNWTVRTLRIKGPRPAHVPNVQQRVPDDYFIRSVREDKSFKDICQQVVKLLRKREKRVCFVKYLEESFEIRLKVGEYDNKIRQVFPLSFNNTQYLLMNAGCMSHVYKWTVNIGSFEEFITFESGPVDQVVLVPAGANNSTLQFITNAETTEDFNCTLVGLSSWDVSSNATTQHRSFGSSSTVRIHQHTAHAQHFFVLDRAQHAVHEYSKHHCNISSTWHLPVAANITADSYRFLPQVESAELALSNGKQILIINKNMSPAAVRDKRSTPFRMAIPVFGAFKQQRNPSESILKPNTTDSTRKLAFADFKQVVERIIYDLIYRLNLEVNITQLSIPESDLYDEHLVQDFIAIMQELQKQRIFKAETFAEVNLEMLQIPTNPAQVLAARTVQIIWPVVVEIEEVHSYLRENETHTHPICANITNSLGLTVKQVLSLANKPTEHKTKDYTKDMTEVIERIRVFQSELDELAKALNADIKNVEENQTKSKSQSNSKQDDMVGSVFISQPDANDTISYTEAAHIPSWYEGEVISLEVGSTTEPRTLIAVTTPLAHLVAGQHDGIRLYADLHSGHLFQTVGALKPRSLVTLRIRDETLLAFVEDCCLVRVLIYRGVQGFVEFIQFTMHAEVRNLVSMSLPVTEWESRYFLAANLGQRVQFYEAMLAGDKSTFADIKCE